MSIEKAKAIAKMAHATMMYDDKPYYEGHVLKVAEKVSERSDASYGMIEVALLHDVLRIVHTLPRKTFSR